jgi:hypothetical protein
VVPALSGKGSISISLCYLRLALRKLYGIGGFAADLPVFLPVWKAFLNDLPGRLRNERPDYRQ